MTARLLRQIEVKALFWFNESMDTSSIGFRIPSIVDILSFLIFQLWPIAIIVYIVLFGLLKRFVPRIKHTLIFIFSLPLIIFFFISLYELFVRNSDPEYFIEAASGLLLYFGVIGIISLCSILPVSFLQFLLKKRRSYAIYYIILLATLFLFFYPKSQLTFYESEDRMVPAYECTCLGVSENNITNYYDREDHRCFGIPVSCKETTKDLCPFVRDGEECSYYELD